MPPLVTKQQLLIPLGNLYFFYVFSSRCIRFYFIFAADKRCRKAQ